MDLAWVVPMGLLVGLSLGTLGAGGSILTIPALIYLLGQGPRAAAMGSLVIVATTSLVGMIPHLRHGRVRVTQGIVFGLLGVVGSVLGSHLSAAVSGPALLSAFAGLLFVVAWLMMRRARSSVPGGAGDQPDRPAGLRWLLSHPRELARLLGAATGVGLLTGFFGVGGGFAVVPALVLVLGLSMPTAVGTSLIVIAVNSLTAMGSRLGLGIELDWAVIGGFSVFAVVGSLLGARVARRVDPRRLTLAFVVLLVIVAAYTAAVNVPQLSWS